MEESTGLRGQLVNSVASANIVKPHSDKASYYKFRAPYSQLFFKEPKKKLSLSPESRLLDLCCGSGQLAQGLAGAVDHVVAVDGADGMIAIAKPHPNITYVCHDINSTAKPLELYGDSYSHMLLGRAIPYVSPQALKTLADNNLSGDGAIVVCGAGLNPQIPWIANFKRLRESYASIRGDFIGATKLAELGFHLADTVLIKTPVVCNPRFLVAHALSYALTHEKIVADINNFKTRVLQAVTPYIKGGELQGEVLSWALIYKHMPDTHGYKMQKPIQTSNFPFPL